MSRLRAYLAERYAVLFTRLDFADALADMIFPDDAFADRMRTVSQRPTSIASAP